MSDHPSMEDAGIFAALVKLFGSPAFIGMVAGGFGFMWSWPTTKREGFIRIVAAGMCSHFFGPGLLKTALHFAPWFVPEDISAGVYLIAGLPGWWILAFIFKWLDNRRGQDIGQVGAEVIEGAKQVKEIM